MMNTLIPAPPGMPAWKRIMDWVLLILLVPALLLLFIVLALLIKLVSRGPVFFMQDRIGYRGKRFRLYKFRTMHCRADTEVHRQHIAHLIDSKVPMEKLDARGDSRLIPWGRIIRASGLDELPQLINVVKGEMSLVGPRPWSLDLLKLDSVCGLP
jgi:lipopolysaccharide/colanic/teichoic acid biosynthesis glycosyltransferase